MTLKIGDTAPDFQFTDEGKTRNFYEVDGKRIVFFFPKAFTTGCTIQSKSMQDNYELLQESGISEIFGISVDPPEVLDKFCNKYNFEYKMVSDITHEISKSYGVLKNYLVTKFSDRDTFVVNENNRIIKIFENGIRGNKSELGLDKHGIEIVNYLKL